MKMTLGMGVAVLALAGVAGTAMAQTGNYGDGYGRTVRCESNDNRPRQCAMDTRGGVRMIRQLSKAACLQGRNWGYDRNGIWVAQGCRAEFVVGGHPGNGGYGQTIRCESNDNRNRRCAVDTRGGVQLVRQLSRATCMQGRNWGYDRSGIWVSQGCRAEFALRGRDSGYYGNGGYGQMVRCESNDNRQRTCNAVVRRGVILVRQLSKTQCRQGYNWGWNRSGVWVNGGCRAEFRID